MSTELDPKIIGRVLRQTPDSQPSRPRLTRRFYAGLTAAVLAVLVTVNVGEALHVPHDVAELTGRTTPDLPPRPGAPYNKPEKIYTTVEGDNMPNIVKRAYPNLDAQAQSNVLSELEDRYETKSGILDQNVQIALSKSADIGYEIPPTPQSK
jgi:hypothetical protein